MTTQSLAWPLLGLFALGAGCAGPKTALVDGKEVPRLTLHLTGTPYDFKHDGAHPRPGGASSGLQSPGGSLRGRVCGMFIDAEGQHAGDHLQLVGSVDNQNPLSLRMDEQGGVRHIVGNMGNAGIDVKIEANRISGGAGARTFVVDLQPNGVFTGFMRTPSTRGAMPGDRSMVPVELGGAAELATMPLLDQTIIVPSLFLCQSAGGSFRGNDKLELTLGGPAADRPDSTSALYTNGR